MSTAQAGARAPSPACPDFPFYDGRPRRLAPTAWAIAFAMCALAFAALQAATLLGPGPWPTFLGMAAFGLINLTGLRLAAGRDWAAAFRRPGWRDVAVGLAGALACMLASAAVASLIYGATHGAVAANPITERAARLDAAGLALLLAGSAIQLVGEEVITLVPFLAILTVATGRLHSGSRLPRRPAAIGLAWVGSALVFAALHLPTYDWRIVQTLAVIGVARLVLTAPYLITRNLWSSVIAHVANDWTLMLGLLALR
ncbi:MAG: CPBP family intramembrane glutamic endopeptidase [Pseudomonadota bacterium]